MDLISIIVPVYNVENYLSKCIESLINQSYKNIQIILVNDGSTDSSYDICQYFSKKDTRILVINKKNQGLGLARNTGLDYVKGKYITFVDSDDYVDNNMIECLYNNIKDKNVDTCIGGYKRVDDFGKIIYKECYKNIIYSNDDVINILLARMLGSSPNGSDAIRMSVWNVMYSADIIISNNLRFPSEREYISEDIIFDIEYYKYSKKVVVIDSCYYNYRVNQKSLTQKYKEDRFEKHKFLYMEICKKISKYNYMNNLKLRLQRQFFVNVRYCLRQENISISGNTRKEAMNNIKRICDDPLLNKIIKTYPVKYLNIKQKIFIYLIKYNMDYLIYILIKLNIC